MRAVGRDDIRGRGLIQGLGGRETGESTGKENAKSK